MPEVQTTKKCLMKCVQFLRFLNLSLFTALALKTLLTALKITSRILLPHRRGKINFTYNLYFDQKINIQHMRTFYTLVKINNLK